MSARPDSGFDLGSLFERVVVTYERGLEGLRLTSRDWPVLIALIDRLDRDGLEAATDAERRWLAELQEELEYADVRAAVAGPGVDNAIARARLTDERRDAERLRRRGRSLESIGRADHGPVITEDREAES